MKGLGAVSLRLAATCGLAVAGQTAVLAALGEALDEAVPLVNAAILYFATSVLGGALGLRTMLAHTQRRSPAFIMPSASILATGLFVLPRLIIGPFVAAILTLAAALFVAPFLVTLCTRWVFRVDREGTGLRRGLMAFAPPAAMALTVLATEDGTPFALFVALSIVVSLAGAAYVKADVDRQLKEARSYTRYLAAIEVGVDEVVRPPTPDIHDPWLLAIEREVAVRLDETANEAAQNLRARDQIAEARDLRTRFMAAMSHELRSPLNSILGFSEILEQGLDGPLNEAQRESAAMIRRSSKELILLLTDVLDLARLEAGRLELHRGWTPSVEILTDAVKEGNAIVEGRHVQIEAELQPGLPPVHVDSRRIVQAVTALFRSAASSLRKTTIRLRARIEPGPPGPGPHLRVEVHDAIGAISSAEVDRIFEAFREITAPTGRRVGGLGMSLALSRGLVRLHGGDVWAYSVPDEGTVLCVALPLDAPKAASPRK